MHSLSVQINRERAEDGVQKTVEVFNRSHEEDEGFANVVDLDVDGKIKTMMWTNGKSRHDYLCFGDAITFDTTYKTNKYNMPFGLFVGVNNHFQSVIFSGVLMRDETIKSFEWVFTQFVKLMGGKALKTILTDQCRAMEVALANKFPDVTHRWCKWHVFKTIKSELSHKYTKEFKKQLNKVCNHMLTPEEFELFAGVLMRDEIIKIFEWVFTQFVKLMGGKALKTILTDQCRAMEVALANKFPDVTHRWCKWHVFKTIKSELSHKYTKEFKKQLNKVCNHMLTPEEFEAGWDALMTKYDLKKNMYMPLKETSTGWPIETYAAEFYTKTMLAHFVEHIKMGASYDVVEIVPRQKYRLDHVDASRSEEWSCVTYVVDIREDGGYYQCECGMWEHMGMLCCHSIRVMTLVGFGRSLFLSDQMMAQLIVSGHPFWLNYQLHGNGKVRVFFPDKVE